MKTIILLLASTLLSFSLMANPLPQQAHIYVEGSATVEVEPDEMQFTLRIAETSKELAQAKSVVDSKSNKLISLSKELNIQASDISTSTLRIHPQFTYKDGNRTQTGTQVSREVIITLRDLTGYANIINALIDAEVTQTVNTTLLLSNPTGASDRAQEKALNDAHQRAKRLAKHQGSKLGKVYSISEFNNRQQEFYQLRVSRNVIGQSSRQKEVIGSRGIIVDSLSGSLSQEPFEPGVIKATAQVFVVYLLNN